MKIKAIIVPSGAYYLIITLLVTSHLAHPVSYFSYRSQGTNAAREMVGIEEYINLCNQDDYYGVASLAGEYTQTFSPHKLAQGLFGNDVTCLNACQSAITVSGSRAANRGEHDWLADYFGLPTDFVSTIAISPQIKNWVADFNVYLGLDKAVRGLYVRFNMPITTTRWNLNQQELVTNSGVNGYDFGYFSENFIFRGQLLHNALNFLTGVQTLDLVVTDNQAGENAAYANIGIADNTVYVSDVVFDPLAWSKWGCRNCGYNNGLSKTAVADFEMVFGYNFLCNERGFLGINARAVAPTGTRPTGEYFFEPVAGNGGHWELGFGISGQGNLWQSQRNSCAVDIYLDANITHLFATCQKRSFDLCSNGLNSRYMLAEKMTNVITDDLSGTITSSDTTEADEIPANYQFDNIFTPVANITASKVSVSVAIEADVALKLAFTDGKGLGVDLGYNFWGRSHEKICRKGPACGGADPLDGKTWALKGDAMVFGYNTTVDETLPVALSATESKATIHSGTNDLVPGLDSFTEWWLNGTFVNDFGVNNGGVDNALFAVADIGTSTPLVEGWLDFIKTSIPSVLIDSCNLDTRGMSSISNKLFAHINYAWFDCHPRCAPFLGFGGSVEFGHTRCQTPCQSATCCASTDAATCLSSSSSGCTASSSSCGTSSSGCGSSSGCCSSSSVCSSSSSECPTNPSAAASQWAAWIKGGVIF